MNDLACRRGERVLFRGLSFALSAGEALQIVGPNGTGKSSLLRIVAGLLRPFAGTVERQGSLGLLDERPALEEHQPLGHALAFWTQIDTRRPESPVPNGEGLGMGERAAGARHRWRESIWQRGILANTLGVDGVWDVPVQYLSTGQRKRGALARLLGQQGAVWLLDEPLNGLDAATGKVCERLVAGHCRAGGIALIASHQPFAALGLRQLDLTDYAP